MSVGTSLVENKAETGGDAYPSVYLAYPYSKPHNDRFLRSVSYTSAYPGSYGDLHLLGVYGFALDVARNAVMDGFKNSGLDYLLCVDNDAEWIPEAVSRLISHNLPMVCGCMYTRDIPPRPTIGHYVGKSKEGTHIYRYAEVVKAILHKAEEHGITHENAENAMLFPATPTDLLEVDGCGFHFVLIRRDVVEALKPPYFQFMGSTTAGEDYFFCRKVKEAGFPIYLDLSVQTGHTEGEEGSYGIKQLLYLTQYLDIDTICNVDSWELGK
jgi:GT2 family glycosyltransferase